MWFLGFLFRCAEAKTLNTVLLDLSFQELLRIMASALGCGLLIGLEREKHNRKESEPSFAGLRSFTICALLGAVCFYCILQ